MSETPKPDACASADAPQELVRVQAQIDEARAVLSALQQDVAQARNGLLAQEAGALVEVNEQLVISMVRAQSDAEAAAQDIAFRELTSTLRLESRRLSEENRQMVEAGRLKNLFLANMSHELRTPLQSIIGFSEILRLSAGPGMAPKHLEYLDHIRSSGGHLLEIINDVLDLAKAASGKLEFHPETVNLPQVVQEVVDMLQPAARRKAVVVSTEIQPGLGPLVLDRTRLKQALSNYLSNAIKFSHTGGSVTLRVRADGQGSFRVEVQDNGVGIAAADQSRLFVEFQQIDSSSTRQHQGTGLGLALTRFLVEAQGGNVGVRSELGAGSTFHFVLKRDAGPKPEPIAAKALPSFT